MPFAILHAPDAFSVKPASPYRLVLRRYMLDNRRITRIWRRSPPKFFSPPIFGRSSTRKRPDFTRKRSISSSLAQQEGGLNAREHASRQYRRHSPFDEYHHWRHCLFWPRRLSAAQAALSYENSSTIYEVPISLSFPLRRQRFRQKKRAAHYLCLKSPHAGDKRGHFSFLHSITRCRLQSMPRHMPHDATARLRIFRC